MRIYVIDHLVGGVDATVSKTTYFCMNNSFNIMIMKKRQRVLNPGCQVDIIYTFSFRLQTRLAFIFEKIYFWRLF